MHNEGLGILEERATLIMSSSSSADHIFMSGQETTTRHVHAAHAMQVAHMLPSVLPCQGLPPSTPALYI